MLSCLQDMQEGQFIRGKDYEVNQGQVSLLQFLPFSFYVDTVHISAIHFRVTNIILLIYKHCNHVKDVTEAVQDCRGTVEKMRRRKRQLIGKWIHKQVLTPKILNGPREASRSRFGGRGGTEVRASCLTFVLHFSS